MEQNFYTQICNASELEEENLICKKFDKDFKKVRKCINTAMKQHMMSPSNSKEYFHKLIVAQLKQLKL